MSTVVCRDEITGRNLGHNLIGRRYGMLEVIAKTDKRENGYVLWTMRCDCGIVRDYPSYRVQRGAQSCGCTKEPTGRPRIPESGAWINHMFLVYTKGARERNIEFALSKEELRSIVEKDCAYCGVEPHQIFHRTLAGTFRCNGIDRVDNTKGYKIENCVPCCPMCNLAKSGTPLTNFMSWIKRVYEFQRLEAV